jgi:hypothetical protein
MSSPNDCPRCNKEPEDIKVFQVFSDAYVKLCPSCKKMAWKKDMRSFTIFTVICAAMVILLAWSISFSIETPDYSSILECTIYMVISLVMLVIGVLLLVGGYQKKP